MDRVLLDECRDARPTYPRDPKPTETQAAEMAIDDTRGFEAWAHARDMQQVVFGISRHTEGQGVAIGLALIGSERNQVTILAQMAQRLSKPARVALGARILLEVEKDAG
jgi:hypothetical protein